MNQDFVLELPLEFFRLYQLMPENPLINFDTLSGHCPYRKNFGRGWRRLQAPPDYPCSGAEAEADRIRAESRIQTTDLERRAMYRFLQEEGAKQLNIEAITRDALPLLEDKSAPQNVANDWITNFFDKARIVSDADMQQLWSRILAGEATAPGMFSNCEHAG